MPNTVLGKVSVTPKGAWSGSSSYEKLDIVSNGGNSYIALQNVPAGTALSNSSYWLVIAEKGDKGDKGNTGATGATGATGNGISSVEVEETSVVGNVHTYTLTISMTDGTSEVFTYDVTDGAVTSVGGLTGDIDGDDLTVGTAKEVLSDSYVADSVPYLFRQTPQGNVDRLVETIVGGSIAWDQLAKPLETGQGITASAGYDNLTFANGVLTAKVAQTKSATARILFPTGSVARNKDHVYIVSADILSPYAHPLRVYTNAWVTIGDAVANSWTPLSKIFKITSQGSTSSFELMHSNDTDFTTGDEVKFRNVMWIDLTQMFGSTIADYLYGLDSSGITLFKSLFSKPYYPYNIGELMHVNTTVHKTVGFNQFDKSSTTYEGALSANSSGVRIWTQYTGASSVAVRCLPNTTYNVYIKDTTPQFLRVGAIVDDLPSSSTWTINLEKVFIEAWNTGSASYTTGARAKWIIVQYNTSAFNKDNINVNISCDRDGEYEPYESHTYPLDSDLVLRGVPKLVDSKIKYDGDTYHSDGTVERRYAEVDLGTLTWTRSTTSVEGKYRFYTDLIDKKDGDVVCSKYSKVSSTNSATETGYAINITTLFVYDSNHATDTAEQFKTAMSGVMLVYELATPTTESADPYIGTQIVSSYGTEEYVDTRQVAVPVGHDSEYHYNLKAKIEGLPWNFSSLIAPNEATNKASQNYTVGSFLIMNNTLYKVTSAIANGGTITVGTNVTATTIMAEILAL